MEPPSQSYNFKTLKKKKNKIYNCPNTSCEHKMFNKEEKPQSKGNFHNGNMFTNRYQTISTHIIIVYLYMYICPYLFSKNIKN